ncbi:MAG: hypothetical protein ACFFFC_00660 [Candidatus Thorarchaeota archaeon]
MKNIIFAFLSLFAILALGVSACTNDNAEKDDVERVQRQQKQCAVSQPLPAFDWSLERHLVIQLYRVRNSKVATHSVWRSDYGIIEGDCPSYGYGIPYDTSLTNPLMAVGDYQSRTTIEQAEPNCLFASKNTQATWVMCLGAAGDLEPVYVETKVTVYPGPVEIDYEKNRVLRKGAPTVLIKKE